MSVPATSWIIRIFKSWGVADMTRSWVNNYELVSGAAAYPADMVPVLNTLVAAEKLIHYTPIQFLQATIATWEPEGRGNYDPNTFVTVALSGAGSVAIAAGDELADSNVCLMVRLTADAGRTGRRFYRGSLSEANVTTNSAGISGLASGSTMGDTGSSMAAYRSALAPLLPGGAGVAKLTLIGRNKAGVLYMRPVTGVHTGGVVVNRRNHRYFDRHAFG